MQRLGTYTSVLSLHMLTGLAADSSVDRCHRDRQDKQMIMYTFIPC
jgi:hypothetical protein